MEIFRKSRSIRYHCALLTKLSKQASKSTSEPTRPVVTVVTDRDAHIPPLLLIPKHVQTDQNPNPSLLYLKTHNSLGEEKSPEWGITQICFASQDVFK